MFITKRKSISSYVSSPDKQKSKSWQRLTLSKISTNTLKPDGIARSKRKLHKIVFYSEMDINYIFCMIANLAYMPCKVFDS